MEHNRSSPATSNPMSVGDVAPGFELRWTFGKTVTRKLGKPMVVAFYVFDFGAF